MQCTVLYCPGEALQHTSVRNKVGKQIVGLLATATVRSAIYSHSELPRSFVDMEHCLYIYSSVPMV